jgi:deoxyribodipyrimidine photo-lyase
MFDAMPAVQPTPQAAQALLAAVRPAAYARTRNALDGAVTGLSPYLTHGLLSLPGVLADIDRQHALDVQHKLVFELGWRAYFRHVWQHRGDGILASLRDGPLPDAAYASELPADIRTACTGLPVIDTAVRTLYATGTLHNHARMWLASYVVHVRKVHWRAGADWLYGHLLDGDLASNHLSWQWVAGTGSAKPYLFNAENVARYAPPEWHSPGTVIDTGYDELERICRSPRPVRPQRSAAAEGAPTTIEPTLGHLVPDHPGLQPIDTALVQGRDVWLVHPWSLGALPADLPPDTVVLGLWLDDFHRAWAWSPARWAFVQTRMAALAPVQWQGSAGQFAVALRGARSVRSVDEPHLARWLPGLAECRAAPGLFPAVDRRCDSFSQWWHRVTRGLQTAADLLDASRTAAW